MPEEIMWFIGIVQAVPNFLWGCVSTFLMTVVLPKTVAHYRRKAKDQRKILYRNIVTLLGRDSGWLGQHGTNKLTYGTTMSISWGMPPPHVDGEAAPKFDEAASLKVMTGATDQASILYDADKASIIALAKKKLDKVVEDEVQNRGAGVNMFVGTLVSQSTP